MTRAGRGLETLIALLEKILGDSETLSIDSPLYVDGINSGERREIDVGVRGKVGSTEILVAIECRDWSATQGVAWMEQLATKARDVGASKTVAVSTSGFTDGAIRIAESEGIETRTLNDVDQTAILTWCLITGLELWQLRLEVHAVGVDIESPEDIGSPEFDWKEPVLRGIDGKLMSAKQVIDGSIKAEAIQPPLAKGERRRLTVELNVPDSQPLELTSDSGWVPVQRIRVVCDAWWEVSVQPLTRTHEYSHGENLLLQTAEVEIPVGDERMVLGLHRDGEGRTAVTARTVDATPVAGDVEPPSADEAENGEG